jgi:hypothetical protein
MASGPTIMAAISMDAAGFNNAVAGVTARTNAMAAQMAKAGFDKAGIHAAVAAEQFAGMRGELIKMGMTPAAATAALRAQSDARKAVAKAEHHEVMELLKARDEAQAKAAAAKAAPSPLGSMMKGMAAFMTVDFLRSQAMQIVEYGGHVSDLADRMGISSTAVQQWDFALRQNGSSIDSAVRFFERLAMAKDKALGGDAERLKSFEKFGIGVEQLRSMRLEDIGAKIGESFKGGADPQPLMADLRALGGRAAGEMITTFSAGLQGLFDQAPVIDAPFITQLDAIGDKLDSLKQRFMSTFAPIVALMGTVGAAVVDHFLKPMEAISSIGSGAIGGLISGFKEGDGFLGKLMGAVTGAGRGTKEGASTALKNFVNAQSDKPKAESKAAVAAIEDEANLSVQQERLQKQLNDKLESNEFSKLETNEEKRMALLQRRARLEQEIAGFQAVGKTSESLKSQLELAGIDKDISEIDKKEREDNAKLLRPKGSTLAFGGFLGNFRAAAGPEAAAANATIKSEQHLREMKLAVQQLRDVMAGKYDTGNQEEF